MSHTPVSSTNNVASDTKPTLTIRISQKLAVFTALLIALTPIIYLNGRGFHDGWYRYLNLDGTMFPVNTADMLAMGGRAWIDGLSEIVTRVFAHIHGYEWVIVLMIISAAFVIAGFQLWSDHVQRKMAQKKKKPEIVRIWWHRWIRRSALWTLTLAWGVMAVFMVIVSIPLGLGVMIAPFASLGRHEVKQEIANNFRDLPILTLKMPDGNTVNLPEIGCGPAYCAAWNNDRAITVPVSAVTWAVSLKPSWGDVQPIRNKKS